MATEPKPEREYGHVPMTEEFDDAKHNLPPAVPVIIALVVVGAVVAVAAVLLRQPPAASGAITAVNAIELPQQNSVMCAVTLSLQNRFKKPIVIKGISVTVHTADQGDLSDDAAPAPDYSRYLEAFPALKENAGEPLRAETTIPVGGSVSGTIIVAFPVVKEKFEQRKGLRATVQIYDRPSVSIDQK